jgi:type I restriction enzyme S subunit
LLLTQPSITEYIGNIADTAVSAYPSINPSDISALSFNFPEFRIQNRIADVWENYDQKIALNRAINDNLEAMAKQLYDYWFVQFDFPNEEGKPYKSSGGKMVWNDKLKREIPENWGDCKLRYFINLFDSMRIPLSSKDRERRKGNYPYYGATGIMDYVNDYIFDGDYILLAEDGSTSDANGFPIVQYIWGKNWVNNHAHIILPKRELHKMFTYQMLKNIPAKKIETGSIQKKISQENLCGYNMLFPEIHLLEQYEAIIIPLWERRKKNIEEIEALIKQRDELLPLLMNGQVSPLNSD